MTDSDKTITAKVTQSASMTMELKRAHTSRRSNVDDFFHRVHSLATLSRSELSDSATAQELLSEIATGLEIVDLTRSLFYRGRPDADDVTGWKRMGPPPAGSAIGPGRYNRADDAILYLASTIDGVRREKSERRLCIQEYALTGVRIADLAESAPPRLAAAFDAAEELGRGIGSGQSGWDFTWFLADALREAGYDGFLVCGVRGDAGTQYCNLAVFDPEAQWRSWSLKERGFHRDP